MQIERKESQMTSKGILATALFAAAFTPLGAIAQDAPFGGEDDIAYAGLLWEVMEDARLVGDNALYGYPYAGIEPHGFLLETFYEEATVDGHTGTLVVKRNFGPEGVETDTVIGDPDGSLAAVTIMFQREAGYDEENQNWYWVKYLPDGSLDQNPAGMQLAGRVGKGADQGCIACHVGAGGDDYLFTTDAIDTAMAAN